MTSDKPNATMTIKKIEYSLEFQCSGCRKMRPVHMFIDQNGNIARTCDFCRSRKSRRK